MLETNFPSGSLNYPSFKLRRGISFANIAIFSVEKKEWNKVVLLD